MNAIQTESGRNRIEDTIRSGQNAAHHAVDRLAESAERVAGNADRLAQRGAEALREGSQQLREHARHATDSTIVHIRQEPVKAVLVAGAIGAVLGAMFTLLGRMR